MVATHSLLLLVILTGYGQQHGITLAQAYQDSEHYYLPPNIYDNLPPGVNTPIAGPIMPTPTSAQVVPRSSASIDSIPALIGPDDTLTVDIKTPLLNSFYTPGSDLVVSWTNKDITFPDNWVPSQSLLDTITKDPNFSNSPVLTKDDLTNLAKIKLVDLKRAQLNTILKDSPVLLRGLRLVSWPLQSSMAPPTTGNQEGKSSSPFPSSLSNPSTSYILSPSILSDPGFTLQNISQFNLSSINGGQLTWKIPEDWEYEGEFEIRIPSLTGNGDSTNKDVVDGTVKDSDNNNNNQDYRGEASSFSFWIMRDLATRIANPQYNLPSMDQQQQHVASIWWHGRDIQRQKDVGVFLGVATMMVSFILIGLGAVIAIYRRRWVAEAASTVSPSGNLESDPLNNDASHLYNNPSRTENPYDDRSFDPFVLTNGDEDAHSPTDLHHSEIAARRGSEGSVLSEKAMGGRDCKEQYSPIDSSFVELPLYKAQESSTTLTSCSSSNRDLQESKEK
ncbi:hypothetical protein BGZ76_008160 [Entomortierella beljakovae]|nr:hypothetical protein BGZ76_008160 [Entomortierella beljakovae]